MTKKYYFKMLKKQRTKKMTKNGIKTLKLRGFVFIIFRTFFEQNAP